MRHLNDRHVPDTSSGQCWIGPGVTDQGKRLRQSWLLLIPPRTHPQVSVSHFTWPLRLEVRIRKRRDGRQLLRPWVRKDFDWATRSEWRWSTRNGYASVEEIVARKARGPWKGILITEESEWRKRNKINKNSWVKFSLFYVFLCLLPSIFIYLFSDILSMPAGSAMKT